MLFTISGVVCDVEAELNSPSCLWNQTAPWYQALQEYCHPDEDKIKEILHCTF